LPYDRRKSLFDGLFSAALLLATLFLRILPLLAHFCGENKVPYGLEVYRNGQPQLLCSRPNCFDKIYSDCDERAMRKTCDSNTTWVGGFDKSYGLSQPLYLQCCEYEFLPAISDVLYTDVIIRPGEYYEGEEVMDKSDNEEMTAFDLISNMRKIGGKNSTDPISYAVDVRRVRCNEVAVQKRYKPWHWP